jgi:hypothetical protein
MITTTYLSTLDRAGTGPATNNCVAGQPCWGIFENYRYALTAELDELATLYDRGAIDAGTYARALAQARDSIQQPITATYDVLGVDARKDVYIEEKPVGEVMGGFTYDGNVKWLTGNPMELISRELDYLDLNPFAWHRQNGWLTLGLGEGSDGIERSLAIQIAGDQCVLWGVAKREGAMPVVARLGDGPFEAISDEADDLISKHANAILAAKSKQWRKQPASEAQQRFAQKLGVWHDGGSKGDIAAAITHTLVVREIEKGMRHGNVLVRATMPAA